MPPAQKDTKWTHWWWLHWLFTLCVPQGGRVRRKALSTATVASSCVQDSLFRACRSSEGLWGSTAVFSAHIWTHPATMETTKQGELYLSQASFTGIVERPFSLRAPEWQRCARGCCAFQRELPFSEGPEKGSGLVLVLSWKEGVVPLGGTCVVQNLMWKRTN